IRVDLLDNNPSARPIGNPHTDLSPAPGQHRELTSAPVLSGVEGPALSERMRVEGPALSERMRVEGPFRPRLSENGRHGHHCQRGEAGQRNENPRNPQQFHESSLTSFLTRGSRKKLATIAAQVAQGF